MPRLTRENQLAPDCTVVVAGAGNWLARRVLADVFDTPDIVSLEELLGANASAAAPAFAVAMLAARYGIGV